MNILVSFCGNIKAKSGIPAWNILCVGILMETFCLAGHGIAGAALTYESFINNTVNVV
ncbi:MAG TPA: hypothetical protein VKA69_10920 [Desulfobacteria bacterium]|nr:hypothetical protein [Desulfobacteria bacterium]